MLNTRPAPFLNPLISSLAILIPDSFRANPYRATRISAWHKRTLQSSISCLTFSAPAYGASDVRIPTVASRRARGFELEISFDPSPASSSNAALRATVLKIIGQRMQTRFGRERISSDLVVCQLFVNSRSVPNAPAFWHRCQICDAELNEKTPQSRKERI